MKCAPHKFIARAASPDDHRWLADLIFGMISPVGGNRPAFVIASIHRRCSPSSPTLQRITLLAIRTGLHLSARFVPLATQAEERPRWRWRSPPLPITREPTDRVAKFRKGNWPRPATRVLLRRVRLLNQSPQPKHFPERSSP